MEGDNEWIETDCVYTRLQILDSKSRHGLDCIAPDYCIPWEHHIFILSPIIVLLDFAASFKLARPGVTRSETEALVAYKSRRSNYQSLLPRLQKLVVTRVAIWFNRPSRSF